MGTWLRKLHVGDRVIGNPDGKLLTVAASATDFSGERSALAPRRR